MVIFGPIDQLGCLQGLFERGRAHRFERPGAERAAGGGDHDAADVLARAGAERLEDRVVLGIDRQHARAVGSSRTHEHSAGADEALLVGERNGRAPLGGGERGLQPDRAADRSHHPVGRPLRRLRSAPPRRWPPRCRSPPARPSTRHRPAGSATAAKRAPRSRASLASAVALRLRGHRFDPIAAVAALEQIDGAGADRAGRAQAASRCDRGSRPADRDAQLRINRRPSLTIP